MSVIQYLVHGFIVGNDYFYFCIQYWLDLYLFLIWDALCQHQQEFQMKMESLQQRREELERKEFHLKESLLKFDKFLKVKFLFDFMTNNVREEQLS